MHNRVSGPPAEVNRVLQLDCGLPQVRDIIVWSRGSSKSYQALGPATTNAFCGKRATSSTCTKSAISTAQSQTLCCLETHVCHPQAELNQGLLYEHGLRQVRDLIVCAHGKVVVYYMSGSEACCKYCLHVVNAHVMQCILPQKSMHHEGLGCLTWTELSSTATTHCWLWEAIAA